MHAGAICYRLFCRPDLSSHRAHNHRDLVAKARPQLRRAIATWTDTPTGPVATYIFRASDTDAVRPRVLLVHGWTSEASFMAAFVGPLLQRGYDVVAFDHPAHGRSGPGAASLIDISRATLAVANAHGPFDAAVAHSIGCLAALLTAEGGAPLKSRHTFAKLVLIAAPDRLADMTGRFADQHRLTPAARRAFEKQVERIGHRPLTTFRSSELLSAIEANTLLIHARDDATIPVTDSEAIVRANPQASRVIFDDLGHARVLYAPPVIREVRAFLDR